MTRLKATCCRIYIITYQPRRVFPSINRIFTDKPPNNKQRHTFNKTEFGNDSMQILNSTSKQTEIVCQQRSTKSRNKRSQLQMQLITFEPRYLQYEKCTKWPFKHSEIYQVSLMVIIISEELGGVDVLHSVLWFSRSILRVHNRVSIS